MSPSPYDDLEKLHDDAHHTFQRLWTRAVGTDGYIKAEWMTVERQLHVHCHGCLSGAIRPAVVP